MNGCISGYSMGGITKQIVDETADAERILPHDEGTTGKYAHSNSEWSATWKATRSPERRRGLSYGHELLSI